MSGLITEVANNDELVFPVINPKNIKAFKESAKTRLPCEKQAISEDDEYLLHPLSTQYRRISLSFLRWRNGDGWPAFSLFDPFEDKVCKFSSEVYAKGGDSRKVYSRAEEVANDLAGTDSLNILGNNKFKGYEGICNMFNDVFDKLSKEAVRKMINSINELNWGIHNHHINSKFGESIYHKFAGIIPEETRAIIRDTRKYFDKTLIICEAAEWKHEETSEIAVVGLDPDPLVIGMKDGHSFLITSFDLTTSEKLVMGEFTE